MDAGAYGVFLLRPVIVSGDCVLRRAVDVEFEIVGILFARDLPPELDLLGCVGFDDGLEDRLLAAVGIAAPGRVALAVVNITDVFPVPTPISLVYTDIKRIAIEGTEDTEIW